MSEYVTEAPDDLPPGIESWPYSQRIEWATSMYRREGLIRKLLTMADYPQANQTRGKDHHLTKDELAAIYLLVREVS